MKSLVQTAETIARLNQFSESDLMKELALYEDLMSEDDYSELEYNALCAWTERQFELRAS
jgi:hypothetical protein